MHKDGPTLCAQCTRASVSTPFWDYFRNAWIRNAGLRIDHLLLNPPMADRLVSADVDREVRGWERASDHAPVWVELAERRPRQKDRNPGGNK